MKKTEPVRMEFKSYQILKSLIEEAMKKLERDFQIACNFIPPEDYIHGKKSSIEKAHKIFSDQYAMLTAAKEQLHVAVASTYKDHPNIEMRKFWGLTE